MTVSNDTMTESLVKDREEANELSDGDMPTVSDESIEEVYRPEFDDSRPKQPSKWSLVDDGLRKRYALL